MTITTARWTPECFGVSVRRMKKSLQSKVARPQALPRNTLESVGGGGVVSIVTPIVQKIIPLIP
jgi:hypothetical protein